MVLVWVAEFWRYIGRRDICLLLNTMELHWESLVFPQKTFEKNNSNVHFLKSMVGYSRQSFCEQFHVGTISNELHTPTESTGKRKRANTHGWDTFLWYYNIYLLCMVEGKVKQFKEFEHDALLKVVYTTLYWFTFCAVVWMSCTRLHIFSTEVLKSNSLIICLG